MIAYRATLDVPRELAQFTAKLLMAERRRRGTPRGSRALTCFWQAVLGVRWFRDRTTPDALARDHGISRATAYRYLDEVIEVLAQEAPDLSEALERARDEGLPHVILDGKIIEADRCREKTISVKGEAIDLWYSGKAHAHGGNIQAVFTPAVSRCGYRMPSPARCMTSPLPAGSALPGFTVLPRMACQPSLIPATTAPASACTSQSSSPQMAGSSISIPAPATPSSGRCYASANAGSHCSPSRWRILQHITASPSKIGDIARAALVLTHFEYRYIT